jgi:hypothetical protein
MIQSGGWKRTSRATIWCISFVLKKILAAVWKFGYSVCFVFRPEWCRNIIFWSDH